MVKGLTIGIVSMALWGLVFVLPLYTPQFSSFEISMGRFVFYGLISTVYLLIKGNLKKLPIAHWKLAVIFALTSSLVYYVLIVVGIRCLGAPLATAMCSFLPIMSSLYGNFKKKVFAWKLLILPLFFLFVGLFLMHFQDLFLSEGTSHLILAIGVTAVLTAEMMWVWYSVHNSDFLSSRPEIPSSSWSSLIGVVCLLGGGAASILMLIISPDSCYLPQANSSEIITFTIVSFINGFAASWLTLYLWNMASRYVPIAILGQISVFEVLFGLSYIYLKTNTYPSTYELLGVALILLGLMITFRRISTAQIEAL